MYRFSLRLSAYSGLLLMFAFVAALVSSPILAHDVHDDDLLAAGQLELSDPTTLLRAFRESGDDTYLDRAWMLVQPQLEAKPDDTDILIRAALVAQARHEFDTAIGLTLRALEARPDDDQAWLLLASIHLVRGENSAADAACAQLRRVPLLITMTCQARVELAENDAKRVYEKFRSLLELFEPAGTDDSLLAWSLSVAGDLAKSVDQPAQAVDYFTRSLALAESTQVRSALVDVLIESGELAAAATAIEAGAPALPLEIRRLIVAKRLGQDVTHDATHAHREFQQWIEDEDWLHAREMARFYIDVLERPILARRLACLNLESQREPEDLLLVRRTGEVRSCVQ